MGNEHFVIWFARPEPLKLTKRFNRLSQIHQNEATAAIPGHLTGTLYSKFDPVLTKQAKVEGAITDLIEQFGKH